MNELHNLNIQYDFSETHNYIGGDLQTGDNFGICFIFPYIIWYYFWQSHRCIRGVLGGAGHAIQNAKGKIFKQTR